MENPFANLDSDTQKKIQEIQLYEQSFQQLLMQKKSFDFELQETKYSIEELEKSEGEVFKIIGGQVVVKYDREKLVKEMQDKKDLIQTRLKSMEKQEKEYVEIIESLRKEIMEKISSNKTEETR